MAYNNQNNWNGRPFNNNPNRPNGNYASAPRPVQKITAKPLPADYVDEAETAINNLQNAGKVITNSKLRNLFGLFSNLYDEVLRSDAAELTNIQQRKLAAARVRIIYEIARDPDRKNQNTYGPIGAFAEKTQILQYLLDIGSSVEKFKKYHDYFEALVAYHRYTFGDK